MNHAASSAASRLMGPEPKGLVARANIGGRGQILSLTPEGRSKVPALAAMADANDTEYFGVLSCNDRKALSRILQTLVDRRRLTKPPVN